MGMSVGKKKRGGLPGDVLLEIKRPSEEKESGEVKEVPIGKKGSAITKKGKRRGYSRGGGKKKKRRRYMQITAQSRAKKD